MKKYTIDHCRIGSLEIFKPLEYAAFIDHCRIGSLENDGTNLFQILTDHCRIGSLEIVARHGTR